MTLPDGGPGPVRASGGSRHKRVAEQGVIALFGKERQGDASLGGVVLVVVREERA